MSERLLSDMYDEMAAHRTLPLASATPPSSTGGFVPVSAAGTAGPSVPATAWTAPPARARAMPDEVLDSTSLTFSTADDWTLPMLD